MKLYKGRIDPYSNADEPRIIEIIKEKQKTNMEYLGINQMENMINKAIEEPISRKLQVTTWQPHKDLFIKGSPCLQRLWIRLLPNPDNINVFDGIVLSAQWRSRDLYQAFGTNVFGMIEIGKYLCERIGKGLGMNLKLLQFIDYSNSLHVYEKNRVDVENVFKVLKRRGITFE